MNKTTRLFVLAGVAAGFASTAMADTTGVDRDEVRAIVQEMLSDAQNRTSLADGAVSGHDGKNFFIADGQGNARLNIAGYTMFRYTMNFSSNNSSLGGNSANDNFDSGFSNRQTKLGLFGTLTPNWGYNIWLVVKDSSSSNGNVQLDDAFFTYKSGNWGIKFGQFKPYFDREQYLGDTVQIGAERSVNDRVFNVGRTQGIEVSYKTPEWALFGGFTDGANARNTDWSVNANPSSDYSFHGRGEWRFAGTEEQLKDFTSMPGESYGGQLGAAIFFNGEKNGGTTPISFGSSGRRYIGYTADLQIEGGGFSGFATFHGANTENRAGSDFDDFGVAVQGGWRFTKDLEAFVRYDGIYFDKDRNTTNRNNHFITAGLNYYIMGQAIRLTGDFIVALNKTGDSTGTSTNANGVAVTPGGAALTGTTLGLLGSTKSGEVAVRLQSQFVF